MHRIKILLLFIFLSSSIKFCAQYFGGAKNDKGISFCQINHNFYLTGTTRSFGSGSEDFFLLKLNKTLKKDWLKTWGDIHHDISNDIIKSSDQNFIVVGSSWDAPGGRNDIVLSKYDTLGNLVWTNYYGGKEDDYPYKIIETPDKGFLISGINRSAGKLGAAFLIKTNATGDLLWTKFYDTKNKDIGMSVINCTNSTLFLILNVNSFVGKITNSSEYISNEPSQGMIIKTDAQGNELWRKRYNEEKHSFINKIVYDEQQYFYIVGSTLNFTNGSFDISLRKIDQNANTIWTRTYGGKGYEYGNSIDINKKGDILLTGTSNSFSTHKTPAMYVVKVNQYGEKIWEKTYNEKKSSYGNCGKFTDNNNACILGSSTSISGTSLDICFIKIDNEGNRIKTPQNKD